MAQVTSTITSPTSTIRVNVTKNTKGYQHETSVSLTSTDETDHAIEAELAKLLRLCDQVARREIAERERLDQEGGGDGRNDT